MEDPHYVSEAREIASLMAVRWSAQSTPVLSASESANLTLDEQRTIDEALQLVLDLP